MILVLWWHGAVAGSEGVLAADAAIHEGGCQLPTTQVDEHSQYRGRQPTARAQTTAVIDLFRQGVTQTEIAKRLGIGRASAYLIVKDLPNTAG